MLRSGMLRTALIQAALNLELRWVRRCQILQPATSLGTTQQSWPWTVMRCQAPGAAEPSGEAKVTHMPEQSPDMAQANVSSAVHWEIQGRRSPAACQSTC